MTMAMLRAVIILPGTAVLAVPGLLLRMTAGGLWDWQIAPAATPQFWVSLSVFAAGLGLGGWTGWLFLTRGRGTPAPWNPPKRLVVAGPYRYVRNPMISGVIAMLFTEAIFFDSLALISWAVLFSAANMVYMPLFEEPSLEARFGDDYRDYKRHVPRWLPRLTPWTGG